MRRALRTGLFIGTLLGMSACAAAGSHDNTASGAYASIEAAPSR
jgi:hypothetical protein